MKQRLLLSFFSLLIITGLSLTSAPASAQTRPHWTDQQVERLIQWLEASRNDGLNTASTQIPELTAAQAGGDTARIDSVATDATLALLKAFRNGCCNASLRAGWHIEGDPPLADPEGAIADALNGGREGLDKLLVRARPSHPFYMALRSAYAQEQDPARRVTIAANMDRWRWMPRDLGRRYLLVNAAAFEASLWQDGKMVDRWAVIVGKTKSPTPIFAATISGVILNPWWEIPSSIAAESVAAMVARRPKQAAARGYVREGGRYRQKPGPNNSLGRMKLVMPNPYSVYLHDTPAKALFKQDVRAYSHGCVRVGDALGLVTALLSAQSGWDRERVDALVATNETQTLTLDQPIPVYVAYFTAEPNDTGGIRTFPDIYRRDNGASAPGDDGMCDN
ncbi:MAG: L,D-transpeptidase [Sphingomonadales bacterium]|nr:MAG: L,D-transpeptidase [Sphingomonadales bacterium]TNF02693.1 MAG: L,D-transpeptidase [Sphingomonadales bacterium]